MTVRELIERLQQIPQDMPITVISWGCPRDIRIVEIEPCIRYDIHWVEDNPLTLVAVVRG